MLLTAVALWVSAPLLLRSAASLWIVDEQVARASAIVILGGGPEYRPFAAARMYHESLATLVLVPDVALSVLEKMGVEPPQTKVTLDVLGRLAVPRNAIEVYGTQVTSTRDEAEAVKQWVGDRKIDRLLIPTDPFHTRRVDWIFERWLPGIDIRVVAVDSPSYTPEHWWRQENGLITFQNEVVKWLYYHANY